MKHRFRFFMPSAQLQSLQVDEPCLLDGSEHQHLYQVLKLAVGTTIDLCDGEGTVAEAEIEALGSKRTQLSIRATHRAPPPARPLIAAIGALKPGFIDELLPSLTELGCDQLHVFLQSNTAKIRIQEKALQRWQSIAVAASKQCKRPFFPLIQTWPSLSAFVEHCATQPWERIYVQPNVPQALIALSPPPDEGRCFVVGGEKGLDKKEEAYLHQQGFASAHLGPLILRAYTAILASAAILAGTRTQP